MHTFSEEQLINPPAQFRGAPFWAWNGIPEKNRIEKQIRTFKKMGFGGFHIHARTGLSVPYLGKEFMDAVAYCIELAEKEDMFVYLYDEDRFPSGSAGGQVTKNPLFRARTVLLSEVWRPNLLPRDKAIEVGADYLLGAYRIFKNSDGTMHAYEKTDAVPAEGLYYAYSVVMPAESWFNGSCYTDLFNPEAVRSFIEHTHEVYKKHFGKKFGRTIPSIFTDEPHHVVYGWFESSCRNTDLGCYWSEHLAQAFFDTYHIHPEEVLPELFFLREDGNREIKYKYFKLAGEQFAISYADQIGAWCDENHLLFTGHYHSESSLSGQTCSTADLMRQYKAFSLPGIDILRDSMEYTTVKQANSVVRQYGRAGLMCELYGVNHYDARLADYKFMGDWLSALGVSFRVPHLSYLTMEGEAKRDYPPSFGYQSPWSTHFDILESHYARLNMLLQNGKPIVKIAVLHPAESFWLYFSDTEKDAYSRKNVDDAFRFITDVLVEGMLDFDFLSEALMEELWDPDMVQFGNMQYEVIIVPSCKTLRRSTLDILSAFSKTHTILFLDECPNRIDGKLSTEAHALYNCCTRIFPLRHTILDALSHYRTVAVRTKPSAYNPKGILVSGYAYRLTEDKNGKWLFLADTQKRETQTVCIEVIGQYSPYIFNTLTGQNESVSSETDGVYTYITKTIHPGESILLRLTDLDISLPAPTVSSKLCDVSVPTCVPYLTDEPNVLLLDTPAYALDGAPLSPPDEILRINDRLREALHWEKQGGRMAQPWATKTDSRDNHSITLQYTFETQIEIADAFLALEHAEKTEILCNGISVPSVPCGYYIDTSIRKIRLPVLKPGPVILTLTMPFTKTVNPEACYLLGSFGVRLAGNVSMLHALPDKIGFSDLTAQGLPFYGACVSYFVEVTTPQCNLLVTLPHFAASLVSVAIDTEEAGQIAFAPYQLRIPNVPAGKHILCFTAVGGRYNTLAPLHNTEDIRSCSPASWRPDEAHFTPSYNLHKYGILAPPRIEIEETLD